MDEVSLHLDDNMGQGFVCPWLLRKTWEVRRLMLAGDEVYDCEVKGMSNKEQMGRRMRRDSHFARKSLRRMVGML